MFRSSVALLFVLACGFAVPAGAEEVGGGDIVYEVKRAGNVLFSHESHVTALGIDCKACHPAIFPEDRSESKRATMAEMRRHGSCGVCHNGKNAFDVKEECYVCHVKDPK
jgi:c(7)-type cytochrome triheme protein